MQLADILLSEGLALVAETAAAHGGAVWCEASPAGGARFVVRLPEVRP